jgi:signal transduction histidine kinase
MLIVLLGLLSLQIRAEASRAVAREVDRTWRMYQREQRQREQSLLTQAKTIAEIPLLGATIDTHHTNAALAANTVLALLQTYQTTLGGDLYLATDNTGRMLARLTPHSTTPPSKVASPDLARRDSGIAAALKGENRSGFFSDGDDLYQVSTVPVHIGGDTEGTLTLGIQVNDRLAGELKAVSDSDVSFVFRGRIIATTLDPAARQRLETSLQRALPTDSEKPVLLHNTANDLTEIAALPIPDVAGDGYIAIQHPLRDAVSSYRRLLMGLLFAGLGALALLAGLSVALAESVTRPILRIARAAQALSSGDWNQRVTVPSRDELHNLAEAFNHMADQLRDWDEELRREVHRRTEELDTALTELDKAYQQMREFNADAAHELFTPLTIMRGELEVTLKKDRPAEEYRRVLGTVHDEVLRLTRIVEQLLAISRADAGETEFRWESVPMRRVIRDICSQFEAVTHEKDLYLRLREGPEVTVEGDEDRLRQLFVNLLGNAVKFTPPGGSVECSWEAIAGNVHIQVSDTGPGIPKEHQSRIFDRFYRVDRARSRKMGGSGLGLSICKWIVESHHGQISVTSAPGRGTTFHILLPLEQVEASPPSLIAEGALRG